MFSKPSSLGGLVQKMVDADLVEAEHGGQQGVYLAVVVVGIVAAGQHGVAAVPHR